MTHGDLKPSNLMLDPRTGVSKIIDLGANRRFVHLSNKERNNRRAVEDQDRHLLARRLPVPRLAPELCEGLGSLTGSPYYMAPEILLQATRYVDTSGRARSVLEDYEFDFTSFLPRELWGMYHVGLSDLRRGWGIRADIWSWACTVQALLLKTVQEDQRPSSSTISPYDFSFSRHCDEMMEPLHEKMTGEDNVPRFHQWCRVLPLLIVRIALEPIPLTPQAEGCSPALRSALKASLRHQDLRPTADELVEMLQVTRPCSRGSKAAFMGARSDSVRKMGARQPSIEAGRTRPQLVAVGDKTVSPLMDSTEPESSRYATPSLSHGASTFSSPQHTCETASRGCRNVATDADRKVRFEAGTTESTFLVAPRSENRLSFEKELNHGDPVPQGFELVSPARVGKTRTSPLRAGIRPATANATLQTPSLGSARRTHTEPMSGVKAARSHPSTPTRTLAGGMHTRLGGSDADGGGDGAVAAAAANVSIGASDGLGINLLVEDLRCLQVNRPGALRTIKAGTSASVPSSPVSHGRGASMPMLTCSTVEDGKAPYRMPPTMTLGSGRRLFGDDIGGSPRSSMADGRGHKHSSLMATLKKKQVRLKQSSMKLMGKRESAMRSATEDGHGTGLEHGRDGEGMADEDRVNKIGGHERYQMIRQAESQTMSSLPTVPLEMSPIGMRSPGLNMRHAGSASRRSTTMTGDDHSASKPLIRRLFTWSTLS